LGVILTGKAIVQECRRGTIVIDPFSIHNVNPNSYNFHLHDTLLTKSHGRWRSRRIPPCGIVLSPAQLYLGATAEQIGSDNYITTLLGKSSVGRLGIFLNITADLGHLGCLSRWTLELTVVQAVRIYAGMCIGQVAFWRPAMPDSARYVGRYQGHLKPVPNRDSLLESIR
jgi:dCTP deaminase